MGLPDAEALSPLGETKLNAVSTLAEEVLGPLDAPVLVGNRVQQFVREISKIVSELWILGLKGWLN